MRDFTENLESLGDIQGKYPPSTLVLRAQFLYMLQDQFRDLERDYRKISEMYEAEMEKAAKLESVNAEKDAKIIQLEALIENYNRISGEIIDNANHQKHSRCRAMARWCFTKSNYHFVLARHGEDAQENNRRSVLYSKWHKRWLAIAEKFKNVSKPEANAVLAAIEEKHKKEVGQLLMKISELEKLLETADKLLKQKGGFTVKDITFGGVTLEGFKGRWNEK